MKNFTGTICISKTHGGDCEESVRITIQDDSSRCQVLEIRMSPTEFANGLFGLSYRPCEIEVRTNPDLWGMIRQNKNQLVPKPEKQLYDQEEERKYLTEAVKPWKINGWEAAIASALSTQQHNPEYYSVTFYRYITKVEEEESSDA